MSQAAGSCMTANSKDSEECFEPRNSPTVGSEVYWRKESRCSQFKNGVPREKKKRIKTELCHLKRHFWMRELLFE